MTTDEIFLDDANVFAAHTPQTAFNTKDTIMFRDISIRWKYLIFLECAALLDEVVLRSGVDSSSLSEYVLRLPPLPRVRPRLFCGRLK